MPRDLLTPLMAEVSWERPPPDKPNKLEAPAARVAVAKHSGFLAADE